jgi:hypothetical protein
MTEEPMNGPTLREYLETRFNLLNEQIKALEHRFDEKIKEADTRYMQRFLAQVEATTKADMASEKRFENVNEFRKTLTDQTATFVPRTEYSQANQSLSERVSKIEALSVAREARMSGAAENKTDSRSDIALWIGGIMMLIAIITLAISFIHKGP